MIDFPSTEWFIHEGGDITVRCPEHRGWVLLQDISEVDGLVCGRATCEHPGCGWSAEVRLMNAPIEAAPVGGTIHMGVGDSSGVGETLQ